MRVLVTYGSKRGGTEGIARMIADELEAENVDVDVLPGGEVGSVQGYDAFVVGGAAYMYHWLKAATEFVTHHRTVLAQHPLWLFSSGPLGTETVDAQGKDVRVNAGPRELPEFEAAFQPREHRVFFGAFDPQSKPIGFVEHVVRLMPAARNAFPVGDFRDWQEIDDWAGSIASAQSIRAAPRIGRCCEAAVMTASALPGCARDPDHPC